MTMTSFHLVVRGVRLPVAVVAVHLAHHHHLVEEVLHQATVVALKTAWSLIIVAAGVLHPHQFHPPSHVAYPQSATVSPILTLSKKRSPRPLMPPRKRPLNFLAIFTVR
jgi:hypothetical protein